MEPKKTDNPGISIPIKADDQTQAGHYSNLARISHSPEAFQLDFLVVYSDPAFGRLQSRIVLTPGHAKRLARALAENVERYERVHGEIRLADPPPPAGYVQ
jgi:hypothetical protein